MFAPVGHSGFADPRPPGSVGATGDGALLAPVATLSGGTLGLEYVITPRPPVSLKEVERAVADRPTDAGWVTLLHVREYLIPATRISPQTVVSTRYNISRLTAASPTGVATAISLRVVSIISGDVRLILPSIDVPDTGFVDLPLQSAIVSAQEVLQVSVLTNVEVHVTASYVNATVEDYDVI